MLSIAPAGFAMGRSVGVIGCNEKTLPGRRICSFRTRNSLFGMQRQPFWHAAVSSLVPVLRYAVPCEWLYPGSFLQINKLYTVYNLYVPWMECVNKCNWRQIYNDCIRYADVPEQFNLLTWSCMEQINWSLKCLLLHYKYHKRYMHVMCLVADLHLKVLVNQ